MRKRNAVSGYIFRADVPLEIELDESLLNRSFRTATKTIDREDRRTKNHSSFAAEERV